METLFNPIGFEYPGEDIKLPSWAQTCLDKFQQLFADNIPGDLIENSEPIELEMLSDSYAYIKEGMALKAFQYFKLYTRFGFKTFNEYCSKRLKKKSWWARRIIRAAQVSWSLAVSGTEVLPANASQAYALYESTKKNQDEGKDLFWNWQNVLDESKKTNKPITTGLINKIVEPNKVDMKVSIKLSKDKLVKLDRRAKELGITRKDLLEQIIDEALEPESEVELETESDPQDSDPEEKLLEASPQPWFVEMTQSAEQYFVSKADNIPNST